MSDDLDPERQQAMTNVVKNTVDYFAMCAKEERLDDTELGVAIQSLTNVLKKTYAGEEINAER